MGFAQVGRPLWSHNTEDSFSSIMMKSGIIRICVRSGRIRLFSQAGHLSTGIILDVLIFGIDKVITTYFVIYNELMWF